MHDISHNGVGFWSKEALRQETEAYVREFSEAKPKPWLAVRVKHCTPGLRGYLIGAAFQATGARPEAGARRARAGIPIPRSGWDRPDLGRIRR
jgi:hypothetical protein